MCCAVRSFKHGKLTRQAQKPQYGSSKNGAKEQSFVQILFIMFLLVPLKKSASTFPGGKARTLRRVLIVKWVWSCRNNLIRSTIDLIPVNHSLYQEARRRSSIKVL